MYQIELLNLAFESIQDKYNVYLNFKPRDFKTKEILIEHDG